MWDASRRHRQLFEETLGDRVRPSPCQGNEQGVELLTIIKRSRLLTPVDQKLHLPQKTPTSDSQAPRSLSSTPAFFGALTRADNPLGGSRHASCRIYCSSCCVGSIIRLILTARACTPTSKVHNVSSSMRSIEESTAYPSASRLRAVRQPASCTVRQDKPSTLCTCDGGHLIKMKDCTLTWSLLWPPHSVTGQ